MLAKSSACAMDDVRRVLLVLMMLVVVVVEWVVAEVAHG